MPAIEIANTGSLIGTRKRINFVPGSNITLTTADDSGNNRVNVTIAAGGVSDPLTRLDLSEDFMSGSTEVGEVGILNWTTAATSSSVVSAESDHPGIFRFTTNTTSGNIARLHLGGSATDGMFYVSNLDTISAIVRPQQNTNMKVKFGLFQNNNDTGGGTDGIYFEFSTLVGPEWYCITKASSTTTSQATDISVSANTWYRLDIVRNGTLIEFYIDGALKHNTSSNVPVSSALNAGFMVECRDTGNAKSLDVDYFRLKSQALNR